MDSRAEAKTSSSQAKSYMVYNESLWSARSAPGFTVLSSGPAYLDRALEPGSGTNGSAATNNKFYKVKYMNFETPKYDRGIYKNSG